MKQQLHSEQQLGAPQFKRGAKGSMGFVDNRAATVTQNRLQDLAARSPAAVAQRALSELADRRPERSGMPNQLKQFQRIAVNDGAGIARGAGVTDGQVAQFALAAPTPMHAGNGAPVVQFGLGDALKYGALGAAAGVVGASLVPALATATTLGLIGGGIGALYGALKSDGEEDHGPLENDIENDYADGHDSDDEGGVEEEQWPNAQLNDVNQNEDPELYKEIEFITRGIQNLRISQHKSAGNHPVQLARTAGPSYQAGYTTNNFGKFVEITYMRDGKGAIDFAKPKKKKTWKNPVDSTVVNLEKGSTKKGYGITQGNKLAHIQSASRAVHFSIANRITKRGGSGSPSGWTWHHLVSPYKMVLVDREVHRKHGHNGGKLLWK